MIAITTHNDSHFKINGKLYPKSYSAYEAAGYVFLKSQGNDDAPIKLGKIDEITIDGNSVGADQQAFLNALNGLSFSKGGGSGEGLFKGSTIYQNVYDAKTDGVIAKVGNPTYTESSVWNGYNIIRYGGNNQADGDGLLVTMPTDKDTLWLRFLGERWNMVKVYDDAGNQFGNWAAGHRKNNRITPDGGMDDSHNDKHEWTPINVKGHSGKLYVISKTRTSGSFYISGVAFTDNPHGLTWVSAVGLHWAINGGNSLTWNNQSWNNDNLAQINDNTFWTMKIPVVENGKDKLFFINLYGSQWNEGGHVAVYVNGTKLETRLSEQWDNGFFRQRMSTLYNHMAAVKIPKNLIPTGATYLDVQIDRRTHVNNIMYIREAGTLNF